VAEWAYRNGLHKPSVRTVVDAIATDMPSSSVRTTGQMPRVSRYRAMHAVRSKRGDKTMSLWADMDDERAPRDHFVRSFAQRRQQIVGDCYQLKTDVDVYNAKDPAQKPIQVPLDFTLGRGRTSVAIPGEEGGLRLVRFRHLAMQNVLGLAAKLKPQLANEFQRPISVNCERNN